MNTSNLKFSGRPQKIDLEKILQAALELGIDQLSMHAVARQLNVSTAALYRYVASREELLDACVDAFCARIEMPSSEQLPWQEYMTAAGKAFRAALLSMPGMSAYGIKIGPTTPAAFHIIDGMLGVLRRDGFEPIEAFNAFSLITDHVFNAVQKQELFQALQNNQDQHSFKIMQLSEDELATTPHLAEGLSAMMSDPDYPDFDRAYEQQLACLVAGIAAKR